MGKISLGDGFSTGTFCLKSEPSLDITSDKFVPMQMLSVLCTAVNYSRTSTKQNPSVGHRASISLVASFEFLRVISCQFKFVWTSNEVWTTFLEKFGHFGCPKFRFAPSPRDVFTHWCFSCYIRQFKWFWWVSSVGANLFYSRPGNLCHSSALWSHSAANPLDLRPTNFLVHFQSLSLRYPWRERCLSYTRVHCFLPWEPNFSSR